MLGLSIIYVAYGDTTFVTALFTGLAPPCSRSSSRRCCGREPGARRACSRRDRGRRVLAPILIDHVKQLVRERPSTFSLLISDAPKSEHTDWTMELALPLPNERLAARWRA